VTAELPVYSHSDLPAPQPGPAVAKIYCNADATQGRLGFGSTSITITAATSPPGRSPTPIDTATPVRPVLVQTDFAEVDESPYRTMGVGGLAILAVGAAGLAHVRKRSPSRRH
jgi:hypothetical protein